MKKMIARVSGLAMLATLALSNSAVAAGVEVASVVHDDVAGTVIVNDVPGIIDYGTDLIDVWEVTHLDGTGSHAVVASGTDAEVAGATGSFTVTHGDLAGMAADTYTISFVTQGGEYGAAVFAVGNADQVPVTATVVPVLDFQIQPGDNDTDKLIQLNTLTADVWSEDDINLDYATNAQGGMTVTMEAGGLRTGDTAADFEIGQSINATVLETTPADDYYKVSTAANAAGVSFDAGTDSITDVAGAHMVGLVQVADTANAPGSGSTPLTIGAVARTGTEAGSYSDTLTFVASATF